MKKLPLPSGKKDYLLIILSCLFIVLFGLFVYHSNSLQGQLFTLAQQNTQQKKDLAAAQKAFSELKGQDQYKRNETLQAEIKNITTMYKQSSTSYENIVDLRDQKVDTKDLEKEYTHAVSDLSERNYSSAGAQLSQVNKDIKTQQDKLAALQAASARAGSTPASGLTAANVLSSNSLAGSGLNQQKVHADVGDFTVSIISADLSSTRVIVDTASDSDCHDNCPVLSLADYVSRNGAFAGINGTYFCPTAYPSCAGKTNSFDLLVMNKNKHYFNSDNNVYSTNPAVIFSGSSARFVGGAQEWGRDTSVDSVISNFPLLVSGGNVVYGGGSDPKMGSKGTRCFIGATGSTVYIGIVYDATMTESAHVLHALGIQNAMNLDEGGSTALMYNGRYLAGPGRNIPNAVLFVHK